jgi:hypothetical protein
MTRAGLITVLKRPPFRVGHCVVRIDRDVRDYLVRAPQAPNRGPSC